MFILLMLEIVTELILLIIHYSTTTQIWPKSDFPVANSFEIVISA